MPRNLMPAKFAVAGLSLAALALPALGRQDEKDATPPAPPPDHKAVQILFSGKAAERDANWVRRGTNDPAKWEIKDGAMVVKGGDIETKAAFKDMTLHVEFRTPYMPNEKGQARGNSGIGLMSRYEIQVLDSYGIETPGKGDCGALYGQSAPLINACRPPRKWQAFDITFRAPRFGADGKKTENARVTVALNGVTVLNNVEASGATGIGSGETKEPARVVFQDHGNPVEYRNIWVLPLPEKGSDKY